MSDSKKRQPMSFIDVDKEDFITSTWERVTTYRKPVITAVAGFTLP